MPFPRVYRIGPGGGSGPIPPGENWIGADFNWNSISPLLLFQIPMNYRIITCQIIITTAFDDVTATLKVGDLAQVDRYMTDTQNVPSEVGENESNPYRLLPVATDIYLTLAPAASTQGKGVVFIEFDQPF